MRILTCEPLPVVPEPRRKPLGVVALVVALVGVSATLAFRAAAPSAPVAPATNLAQAHAPQALGVVSAASWQHTRVMHRWLRGAVSADFVAAARVAARTERSVVTPTVTATVPAASGYSPALTSQPPAAVAQTPAVPRAPAPRAPSVHLEPDSAANTGAAGPQWPDGG